jgi:Papain-like cysteine protease AvrRpt2
MKRSLTLVSLALYAITLVGSGSAPASAKVQCSAFQDSDYGPVQQCEAGIPTTELHTVAAVDRQHMSEWCWAAAISGVFAYYGHPVRQEEIVRSAYGAIVNARGTPDAIMGALNREWTDDNGNRFSVESDAVSGNWRTLSQDLANGEPLIVGSLGHAMIVTAAEYVRDQYGDGQLEAVIVRDPWPDNPQRRLLTPREMASVQMLIRIRVTNG